MNGHRKFAGAKAVSDNLRSGTNGNVKSAVHSNATFQSEEDSDPTLYENLKIL